MVDAEALAGDVEEDMNTFNKYLGAEMIIDAGPEGDTLRGRVVKRAKGEDGKAMGTAHSNPMLDTHWYEVESKVYLMNILLTKLLRISIHRSIQKGVVR